jgi:hypothetical protein
VFQQIQLSAAVAFQETVGPFSRRGRVLIAGGVVSMRNLLASVSPTRAEPSRRSRILQRCFVGPFQQTIASAVRQGLRATLFAPEKHLGDQAAEKFVRKKIERPLAGCVNA